jgi:hypothetical protein
MTTPDIIILLFGGNGLFTWFLQTLLSANLKEKIRRLESELQNQNFRFSHVFVKTEETLSTVYINLLDLRNATEGIRATASSKNQAESDMAMNHFMESYRKFCQHYNPNEIYIPDGTAKDIDSLVKRFRAITVSQVSANKLEQTISPNPIQQAQNEKIYLLHGKVLEEAGKIPEAMAKLKQDFQKILGFPIPDKEK